MPLNPYLLFCLLAAMGARLLHFDHKRLPHPKNAAQMHHPQITYLALGDSYTIGEAVGLRQTFAYQTVALLREGGLDITAPEIVAATGWTTDELMAAIKRHHFLKQYDLVTLLIGVNNQYRGRSVDNYKLAFSDVLLQALFFAGGRKERVVVLAIPDYSVTPFAKDKNPAQIKEEIKIFNAAAQEICIAGGVFFLDINRTFDPGPFDPQLVAHDGLHPSAKAYRLWAEALAAVVQTRIQ